MPSGTSNSKQPPPGLAAFAAAHPAALAVRDDSACSSMDASPAAASAAFLASTASAASGAATADNTARQLKAVAGRVAAGQMLQRAAGAYDIGNAVSSENGSGAGGTRSGSGGSSRLGGRSGSGSGSSAASSSSLVSRSAASSAADIETWLLLEYCDLGTLQVNFS